MMREHMNVEDCQALGSSQFMLMVSFPYAPVVRHFGIILLRLTTTIMQWFLELNCSVVDAIFNYKLLPVYNCD